MDSSCAPKTNHSWVRLQIPGTLPDTHDTDKRDDDPVFVAGCCTPGVEPGPADWLPGYHQHRQEWVRS